MLKFKLSLLCEYNDEYIVISLRLRLKYVSVHVHMVPLYNSLNHPHL